MPYHSVAPKTSPTFTFPKRQTDCGKTQNESLRVIFERHGTSPQASLSYPGRLAASPGKFIFRTACKAEKSHRTFAARFNRKRPKIENQREKFLKKFRLKFDNLSKIATFALPKRTGRCTRNENGFEKTRIAASNGSSTRSLNDGNRQNSKCFTYCFSFGKNRMKQTKRNEFDHNVNM